MSASDLIKAAKASTRAVRLPPDAMADLREVLAHNAKHGRAQQVTRAAFLILLRKQYKIEISGVTLDRIVRALGKSWSKK